MTAEECNRGEQQAIQNIRSVLSAHPRLCNYVSTLHVTIENVNIVLRGALPSRTLKAELIPAVRSAGVLRRVCVQVQVATRA
jgi:hypothetical protein